MNSYLSRKLQLHTMSVLLNSAFDPDAFASQPIEQPNSTEGIPYPNGDYPGVVEKYEFRPTDKGQLIFEVFWNIDSQELRDLVGRDKIQAKQTIWLDRLENGSLDMGKGKNVQLGKLREALGLNTPGQAFTFSMIEGKPALCSCKDREYEGSHFLDVKGVARL